MQAWLGLPRCALVVNHRKDKALVAALLLACDPEIHGADLQFAA